MDRVQEVFIESYQNSLEESAVQKNIKSIDLFEERTKEIDSNVVKINQSTGHPIFKLAAQFNEQVGGTLRYFVDQAAHTLHVVSPGDMALLNGSLGVLGRGIGEAVRTVIPADNIEMIANAYHAAMSNYHTENQKFLIETTAGIVIAEVGALGLKLVKPKLSSFAVAEGASIAPATKHVMLEDTPSGIIRDQTGKVVGVEETQTHHIIHKSLKKHELWKKQVWTSKIILIKCCFLQIKELKFILTSVQFIKEDT